MAQPPSRRRAANRRRGIRIFDTLLAVTSFASLPTSQAVNFTRISDPATLLDLGSLGQVGIAGDFTGISLHQYEGQNERPYNVSGNEALLARLPNGIFTSVVQADASIRSMCSFAPNGGAQGVIVAGNFTSLSDQESTGIALFNPNTTEITSLTGLQGSVNAVLCDDDTVYVGGNFMGVDNSTNAVSYVAGSGFRALPFAGFNGPVSSISKASNGHIIFGGSFTGLGNTSAPSQPDEQVINLSTANISATSTTTTTGFDNPSNIVCKTGGVDGAGDTWLLADGTAGSWQASMGFGYRPTKLRLYNTHQDGRGTKTWRFTAMPINGILNFTYIDPSTNQNLSCTSECPLSSNTSITFQDFHFVNVIGMDAFRIDISDWYGSGGGLSGIELFQDDILSYAISDYNEPTCAALSTASSSTQTGPWSVSPSLESNAGYLTATLTSPITNDSASVVFFPDIRESGYYTVNVFTPGCLQDATCATRGQIHLGGTMAPSMGTNGTIDASLFQSNNFDKYDPIYYGYVDATSDSFRPSVTLTPVGGQSLSRQTVVAQKVGFVMYNTTGGLNGIFEYDPSVTTYTTTDFESSVFDKLGMNFSTPSSVNALASSGDVTYIGGNFSVTDSTNIVSINSQSSAVEPLDSGLNGLVNTLYVNNSSLFVGGAFDNTQKGDISGLANVALYDILTGTWSSLGAGVDGPVSAVVPLTANVSGSTPEVVISFTGNFSQLNAFGSTLATPVNGFAVWVPSQSNWLTNLDGVEYLDGVLTSSVLDIPGSDAIYAGSVISSKLGAVDAASLSGSLSLGEYTRLIQSDTIDTSSTVGSRASLLEGSAFGVFTGAFLDNNNLNVTVLAGHFTATASNGSTITNVAIIGGSNSSVSGFASGVSAESSIVTAVIQGTTLYAGGNVSGTANGADLGGLVAYDLSRDDYGTQPAALAGDNGTVFAIALRPDTGDLYVGGSFSTAGSLGCPAVCLYSTTSSAWNRPGTNLQGEARSLVWTSDTDLVAGGNLTVNGSTTYLASYTAGDQAWYIYPGAADLPGPVDIVTMGSSDGKQLWVTGTSVNGSVYLMKYDGSTWRSAGPLFDSGTAVSSLQIFSLQNDGHGTSDLLDQRMTLMLTGRIAIPGFGTASAAVYNGSTLNPFALTADSGNRAGTISQVFVQNTDFFNGENGSGLPIYAVVLISLGIALGLTLLIVVAGMAMDRIRKKREGYVPAPTSTYDRGSGMQRIPPHELLESLGKGRPGAPHV